MQQKKKRTLRGKFCRHVYPYTCTGCGKRRVAYVYDRAKDAQCTKCEPEKVNENQRNLFDMGTTRGQE